MKDVDLAWAAGFLDGEGAFTLSRKRVKGYTQYIVRIRAVQVVPAVPLYRLRDLLGGAVKPRRVYGERTRPQCIWSASGANAARHVIPLVLPYLVAKRDQAELLLEVAHTIHRGTPFTEEMRAYREDAIERLVALR